MTRFSAMMSMVWSSTSKMSPLRGRLAAILRPPAAQFNMQLAVAPAVVGMARAQEQALPEPVIYSVAVRRN
jgi:hypothetical protein